MSQSTDVEPSAEILEAAAVGWMLPIEVYSFILIAQVLWNLNNPNTSLSIIPDPPPTTELMPPTSAGFILLSALTATVAGFWQWRRIKRQVNRSPS